MTVTVLDGCVHGYHISNTTKNITGYSHEIITNIIYGNTVTTATIGQ